MLRRALVLIAANALCAWTLAQNLPPASGAPACPPAAQTSHLQLYGLWQAEFEGEAGRATLRLDKHPELDESVKGRITRSSGAEALVVGDVDNGVFTLEESTDGRNIAATWNGQVVEASCGKEIRGTWKNTANGAERAFILRKQPGWQ